jgi:hypothetical protein
MFNKRPNMLKQLASALGENDIWRDLATTVSKVMDELIEDPRYALARIREAEVVQRGDWVETPEGIGKVTYYRRVRDNIDTENNTYSFQDYLEVQIEGKGYATLPVQVLHDRQTLIDQSRNLGFDYFSSSLQDDDYARIVSYLSKLWRANGGEHFIDFMGFIKRTRFEIEQLWTESIGDPGSPSIGADPANELDYYANLMSRSEYLPKMWNRLDFNPLLTVDQELPGTYYPTSHIELGYDILDRPNLDKVDITTLFYMLAPIHLVLERFNETINVRLELDAGIGPMLYSIPQRSIKIEV